MGIFWYHLGVIHAANNPEQGLTEAYDTYADAIFRHCYFRLGNRERAKELMQEAFCKAWEHLQRGKDIEHVQAFLYRIAGNLVIDEIRRIKRRPETSLEDLQEEGFDPASEGGESELQGNIDGSKILASLDLLDDQSREVLVMRFVDGLPPQDIAAMLGVTANVVSVRLHRATKKLKTLLHAQ